MDDRTYIIASQQGDETSNTFREILGRMRNAECTRQDHSFLKNYFYRTEEELTGKWQRVIRLFPENEDRRKCNEEVLANLNEPN